MITVAHTGWYPSRVPSRVRICLQALLQISKLCSMLQTLTTTTMFRTPNTLLISSRPTNMQSQHTIIQRSSRINQKPPIRDTKP